MEPIRCPFCGSNDLQVNTYSDGNTSYVTCGYCLAQGPHVYVPLILDMTKEIIIEAWNQRPDINAFNPDAPIHFDEDEN